VCLNDDHNPEKQGNKFCVNIGVYFNNKKAWRLLSRMVRNMFKQRENPMGMIIIEDHESSCEDTNGKSEEEDHNQYDFFYNLPPFLHGSEDFPGICVYLKRNVAPKKPLDKDRHHSIPNLESKSFHDYQDWDQRYYAYLPYLHMRLDQMLIQNKELKRVNQQSKK
jgi:hypothetical protein